MPLKAECSQLSLVRTTVTADSWQLINSWPLKQGSLSPVCTWRFCHIYFVYPHKLVISSKLVVFFRFLWSAGSHQMLLCRAVHKLRPVRPASRMFDEWIRGLRLPTHAHPKHASSHIVQKNAKTMPAVCNPFWTPNYLLSQDVVNMFGQGKGIYLSLQKQMSIISAKCLHFGTRGGLGAPVLGETAWPLISLSLSFLFASFALSSLFASALVLHLGPGLRTAHTRVAISLWKKKKKLQHSRFLSRVFQVGDLFRLSTWPTASSPH